MFLIPCPHYHKTSLTLRLSNVVNPKSTLLYDYYEKSCTWIIECCQSQVHLNLFLRNLGAEQHANSLTHRSHITEAEKSKWWLWFSLQWKKKKSHYVYSTSALCCTGKNDYVSTPKPLVPAYTHNSAWLNHSIRWQTLAKIRHSL